MQHIRNNSNNKIIRAHLVPAHSITGNDTDPWNNQIPAYLHKPAVLLAGTLLFML